MTSRGHPSRAARPLSLRLYLAASGGPRGGHGPETLPDRPAGPLVMAHAGDPATGRALGHLCDRLRQQAPGTSIVCTGACDCTCANTAFPLPSDTVADSAALASALAPDVVLWADDCFRPALLTELRLQAHRMIALGLQDTAWTTPTRAWLPDPVPATLALFDALFPATEAASRRLRRYGVPPSRLRRAGPLLPAPLPLDVRDDLHEEMAVLLAGRPVWLAARVHGAEAAEILRAHRRAVRLAHRLLLVMVPADDAAATQMAAATTASGLRLCRWDDGDMPDETAQVVLTEDASELGLWYRLAPLAFLGGSLVSGHGGTDPMEAAALGCGILYGPNVGQHLHAYSRLAEAGAARIVNDGDSLAGAVSGLIAPDQAATMAHAGWEVVTEGADLIDAVIADTVEALDEAGARA